MIEEEQQKRERKLVFLAQSASKDYIRAMKNRRKKEKKYRKIDTTFFDI